MRVRATAPADKLSFALLGAEATALATGEETSGRWEAMELSLAPGARSPLHTIGEDKLFYVVAGTVTLTIGDSETELSTGGFAHVPAGTPHCYRNLSGAAAGLLVVTTGSGHVDFLRGMGALTAAGRPDPDELAAHTARHGVYLLPATN
ncbi:cupin domain-containing protein [Streptomyces sp. GC420]|uniref:cupin domain-containing protein n=1 Tax=Streptomyces sp. GC420 TaxID=2697568 RepID=UPI001414FAE9|nr:cupin domain-containing protein [Streptomyces sp. GC420]NBM19666.1 cupin domain-containing protein [Streptomyces sp. GC420]